MSSLIDIAKDGKGAPQSLEPGKTYVNVGREDQMVIVGYKRHRCREILTWIAVVLTIGFLRLVFHWKPDWMLKCTHVVCDLAHADKVLLQDQYKQWFVENVEEITKHGEQLKNTPAAQYSGNRKKELSVNIQEPGTSEDVLRFFVNKKIKYVWNFETGFFVRLKGLEEDMPCSYFHTAKSLSQDQQLQKRVLYGENSIEVHVTPILKLLVTQVLNPFYVFQLFSVILWYNDEYYYYATCIVIMSSISLIVSIYQIRRTERALKRTISASGIVTVCGEEGDADIPSDLLVPGHIIEIPRHGCVMQCDAVLINGNCIVNESMLTGESVPVTKTPLPNPDLSHSEAQEVTFDMKLHSRHVLFCGTKVIQTRYYGKQKVKAVVTRTGFATAKGELVRSIMFPKPVDFKFSQDAFKFIAVLFGIAAIGMIFTLVLMTMRGREAGKIVLRTLDLVSIVVPPALPAAMTIGIVFAQNRLKKSRIFCISPRSINLCGAINTFCFDKTGTLTEDGLDMWGAVPVEGEGERFRQVVHEVDKMEREPFVCAMATCHSLTRIENEISGDPLDLKMFESTGWELDEPGEDTSKFDVFMPTVVKPKKPDIITASETLSSEENIPFEIGIVRQFTFSSSLQRMSVIARTLGSNHFDLYTKGAPEKIASLCMKETLPSDFHDVLSHYTQQGYRVIALAWKPLTLKYVKIQRVQREQVECDLRFLGLLVMENRLKPETSPVIHQLKNAQIKTIMVTGDNMLTALSVARDCHIVGESDKVVLAQAMPPIGNQDARIEWTYAENANTAKEITTKNNENSMVLQIEQGDNLCFAITGKSWGIMKKYFPEIIPKFVVKGTVYARMSPEQKGQLVEHLQDVGYYVGMCGDGANDCGALKTAHAGISLSEAEASVASPFTSQEPNISCVPTTIREGRAALVTSMGVFKYMACYSLTQFLTVTILYWIDANLTDFTFLYIDMILLTSLSITFCYTAAYHDLVPKPPQVSLISFKPLASIICQMVVIAAFQISVWQWVRVQPWFEAYILNEDESYDCHEVTVLFCLSSFQYITLAIIFSKGAPYRKSIFTNYIFLANVVIVIAMTVYICLYPFQWLNDLLELVLPPSMTFRLIIVALSVLNFFLCYIFEAYIIDSDVIDRVQKKAAKKFKKNIPEYEVIEDALLAAPEWPPVYRSTTNLAELMRMESMIDDMPTMEDTAQLIEGDMENITDSQTAPYEYETLNSPKDPKEPLLWNDTDPEIQKKYPSGTDTSPLMADDIVLERNSDMITETTAL